MNLHIVPDNVFINKFCDNLKELGLLENNKIVVRSNKKKLQYIQYKVPFAKLYSSAFRNHTGDTQQYERVYIHQFTPLLYRWVANHHFKELNWMVWGADLYNLPSVHAHLYEKLTLTEYIKRRFTFQDFAYRAKVAILHDVYRNKAYAKVKHVLTWMSSEYKFAIDHLSLRATHQFFFYENQIPYQALDKVIEGKTHVINDPPKYILGNSSTAELNHLDALQWMEENKIKSKIYIPVSYGDTAYARFLKKYSEFYKGGEIEFVDRYMNFNEYFEFLSGADGLIMNNIRPQGYGNILMMMYLGKKVFMNEKNISLPELDKNGLKWYPFAEMKNKDLKGSEDNKSAVQTILSHETLLKVYRDLFG